MSQDETIMLSRSRLVGVLLEWEKLAEQGECEPDEDWETSPAAVKAEAKANYLWKKFATV